METKWKMTKKKAINYLPLMMVLMIAIMPEISFGAVTLQTNQFISQTSTFGKIITAGLWFFMIQEWWNFIVNFKWSNVANQIMTPAIITYFALQWDSFLKLFING